MALKKAWGRTKMLDPPASGVPGCSATVPTPSGLRRFGSRFHFDLQCLFPAARRGLIFGNIFELIPLKQASELKTKLRPSTTHLPTSSPGPFPDCHRLRDTNGAVSDHDLTCEMEHGNHLRPCHHHFLSPPKLP